jgi:sortase B
MSNKTKLRIMVAILVLSVGLAAVFAASLVFNTYRDRQGQAFFAALSVDVVPRPRTLPIGDDAREGQRGNQGNEQNTPPANGNGTVETDSEPTPTPIPTPSPTPFVPILDFDALRQQYPDIIGWIQSEGTVINYPLVQYTDNDYYLERLPDRTRHRWGSIFLDSRNNADFSSQAMTIYGHNMASGDKFGSLKQYENQQFYERHNSMFIFTPTANYLLVIFAGYIVDSRIDSEVPPMTFEGQADFDRYIREVKGRSFFNSDVEVSYGDRIVYLATCHGSSATTPWRRIIAGKLVELDW